jgi:phage portal protein BeeE
MSWLTPIVREIMGDQAATEHKLKFFDNGATVNLAVSLDGEMVGTPEKFEKWIEAFDKQLAGTANAYKTLYLAAGATATPIGADMKQIDFKEVIGKGETRIAAASGVPPVIVGLSEGLEASTYSNYAQARRAFADRTMRPLWRSAAAALATIIDVPSGAELWYDDRDIPFLQEDVKDEAEIQQVRANTIKQLVEAGYDPESVVDAIDAGDMTLLKHTGLYSVQLQKPGTQPTKGNGEVDEPPPAALPAPTK